MNKIGLMLITYCVLISCASNKEVNSNKVITNVNPEAKEISPEINNKKPKVDSRGRIVPQKQQLKNVNNKK